MLLNTETIKRGVNHYYTKLQAFIREKSYKRYGVRVKYIYFCEPTSNTLIVSFPACAKNTAKYNYMRTLATFKCNKLFLLDDFGSNHQGCYLIEENVEKCTKQLIECVIERCMKKGEGQVIFLGSSKGGYSALNFSLLIPNTKVVIGAPQYHLGAYLDKDGTRVNLEYLIGTITEEKKRALDNRLSIRIRTSLTKPQCVYFHYSNVEHTYEEHVKDMLQDLIDSGIKVVEDIKNYPEHGGLATYFPPFLERTLKEIIE